MSHVTHAALSDCGRLRQQNEDRWIAVPRDGLYGVVDGVAGCMGGSVAAQVVADALPALVPAHMRPFADFSQPEAEDRLRKTLVELSEQIRTCSKNRPGLEGMGATLALALVRGQHALLAHLGDCRVYLLRGGKMEAFGERDAVMKQLAVHQEITGRSAEAPQQAHGGQAA